MPSPTTVHLVGSLPLPDETAVFETVTRELGDRVKRIPDGETGPRFMWIGWQQSVFEQTPQLERAQAAEAWDELAEDYAEQQGADERPPSFRLRDGMSAQDVVFPSLGYADAAIASYATFARLQADEVIGPDVRFQVAMGTPLATSSAFLEPATLVSVEPVYEAAQLREVARIFDAIPHDKLAFQWDIAVEVWMVEGWVPAFPQPLDAVVERLVRLGAAVPDDIELGFHMCFGDLGGHHLREPDDTRALVEIINPVAERLSRRIDWWHFPVPIDRDDEAYFAPLADLRLPGETEIFVGLAHLADGSDGALRRARAARSVLPTFGIAAECGLGRHLHEGAVDVLRVHAQAAQAIDAGA
jgi:hypothetical protein